MATITSTPTTSDLTVSGKTQVSGTISWTTPAVPSGATIISCVLTGVATTNMSKGSATVTVNGTNVETTGAQFSIDLGTTNSITSVPTTAIGGNKNASGTVKFSDLTYTVTYVLGSLVVKYEYYTDVHSDVMPTFNSTFTDYTYMDEPGSVANTIIRSIYSNSLPTYIAFGITNYDIQQPSDENFLNYTAHDLRRLIFINVIT